MEDTGACVVCGKDLTMYVETKQQRHINRCLNKNESYKCVVCSEDLSMLSSAHRDMHTVECCDQLEVESVYASAEPNTSDISQNAFSCVHCLQSLDKLSTSLRLKHLSDCSGLDGQTVAAIYEPKAPNTLAFKDQVVLDLRKQIDTVSSHIVALETTKASLEAQLRRATTLPDLLPGSSEPHVILSASENLPEQCPPTLVSDTSPPPATQGFKKSKLGSRKRNMVWNHGAEKKNKSPPPPAKVMPNYSSFSKEQLQDQMSAYGMKLVGKKLMISRLEDIWHQLNPSTEDDEEYEEDVLEVEEAQVVVDIIKKNFSLYNQILSLESVSIKVTLDYVTNWMSCSKEALGTLLDSQGVRWHD